MEKTDRSASERAINRALLEVALSWGVDPARATHNPIVLHDGYLYYYDPTSHREEIFEYLKNRGILVDGFNFSFKLPIDINELADAADADYSRGIDLDAVVSLLVSQLIYQHSELNYFNWRQTSNIVPTKRTIEILYHLCELGYVEPAQPDASCGYTWTEKAGPMLKANYLL